MPRFSRPLNPRHNQRCNPENDPSGAHDHHGFRDQSTDRGTYCGTSSGTIGEREELVGAMGYNWNDYLLALPITLLTLFALGILLIDLMIPPETKWVNGVTALIGVLFATAGVVKIQFFVEAYHLPAGRGWPGLMGSMFVDRFALYFFYLFLAATAVSILMSMRYLKTEHENHGEYYALMLLSVVGMMCMAAGFDIVLIFIGLELMAISTYILVGFLRRDRRSNEAALKYLLLGAFSSGIFAYGLSLLYGLTGSTNLVDDRQPVGAAISWRQESS